MTDIELTMQRIKSDYFDLGLPDYMWGGVRRYLEHGIPPGDFLHAVLTNDLSEAFGRADETNRTVMYEWCLFFYNAVPGNCWRTQANYDQWVDRGGFSYHKENHEHEGV